MKIKAIDILITVEIIAFIAMIICIKVYGG
ncbi:hypothetical protein ES708_13373 [subsurface metagenome]